MIDESWKKQYKEWKDLKPYQVKLIDDGPKSHSQAWLLNSMWCEWKSLRKERDINVPEINNTFYIDPWD